MIVLYCFTRSYMNDGHTMFGWFPDSIYNHEGFEKSDYTKILEYD